MLKKILGALVLVAIIITAANAQAEGEAKEQASKQEITQHIKKGENDLAIQSAKQYLASNPEDTTVINILTEAYINKSDFVSAEQSVKEALAIQPNDPWSCRLLAHIYEKKTEKDPAVKANNLVFALEQVEKGLSYNPDDKLLLAEKARIYARQGDDRKANEAIDRALSIDPGNTFLMQTKEDIIRKAFDTEKTDKK